MKKNRYYRLFCLQNNLPLATGCNTTSLKELISEYISYKSIDTNEKHLKSLSKKEMINYIKSDEFEIERSPVKFEEEY